MKRLPYLFTLAFSLLLSACAGVSDVLQTGTELSQAAGYNPQQLVKAIKEALSLSAERASDQLSQPGAYQNNPRFEIPLPEELQVVTANLKKVGLGGPLQQLEDSMNRGAELAAGEAKSVLIDAVKAMSVEDAIGIVRGGNTAASDYFQRVTRASLTQKYSGIMQTQLQKLSFYEPYQRVLGVYNLLPLANKPDVDLEAQAVNRGLDALYQQMREEEQKIRANPMEQGSLLISSVFNRQ